MLNCPVIVPSTLFLAKSALSGCGYSKIFPRSNDASSGFLNTSSLLLRTWGCVSRTLNEVLIKALFPFHCCFWSGLAREFWHRQQHLPELFHSGPWISAPPPPICWPYFLSSLFWHHWEWLFSVKWPKSNEPKIPK